MLDVQEILKSSFYIERATKIAFMPVLSCEFNGSMNATLNSQQEEHFPFNHI